MFCRVFAAERMKLKESRALFPVAVAPLLIAALQYLNFLLRYQRVVKPGDTPWTVFVEQHAGMWAVLVLPLLAAILSSTVAAWEHGNNQWKHILSLPLKRWQLYTAKLLLVYALLTASTCILGIAMVLSAWLLGLPGEVPGWHLTAALAAPLVGVGAVVAIQLWLGVWFHNPAVPIAVGACGTVAAVFFAQSSYTRWLPWVYPLFTLPVRANDPADVPRFMAVSAVVGILVFWAGAWAFTRRDV